MQLINDIIAIKFDVNENFVCNIEFVNDDKFLSFIDFISDNFTDSVPYIDIYGYDLDNRIIFVKSDYNDDQLYKTICNIVYSY